MKRILGFGLAGWAAIVGLAWWLADRRIALCGYDESGCKLRATAARDTVLTSGLTVALVVAVAALTWIVIFSRQGGRDQQSGWTAGSQLKLAHLRARVLGLAAGRAGLILVAGTAALFAFGWLANSLLAGETWSGTTTAQFDSSSQAAVGAAPSTGLTPVEGDPFAGQTSDAIEEADGQATDEAGEE